MNDSVFVDTNVFIYAVSGDGDHRCRMAVGLIDNLLRSHNAVISYQVAQEFLNVVLTKFKKPLPAELAREYLTTVFQKFRIVHSSMALYTSAIDIRLRFQLSWYDSLIVAAAREAKCAVLYTEDLQHGMHFDQVRVENPFLRC